MKKTSNLSQYELLKKTWLKRHKAAKVELHKKHKEALEFVIDKFPAKEHLASTAVGALMLTSVLPSSIALGAIASAPKEIERDEVAVKSVISLEEMIDRLSGRIERAIQMTFRDFAGTSAVNKREVVVSFLAMLELFKRGLVLVEQEQTFGEIAIAYNGNAKTPKF
ncbi:MAG: hypothetical protein CEO12_669 [Parcubacteria group bacterium Gr01-1014_46]|nr:MAG: hypothetical protein CEO12_669 [Parcubacteria group bacterium Gr01-1014_46]